MDLDDLEDYCTCGKQHKAGYTKAQDGWWVCANCLKPSKLTMNECDVCEKLFRGYRQSFPFAVTCPDCE